MKLTNKLMIGIGIGSVVMNGIRILFKATVNSKDVSSIVFFSLTSAYLFFTTILSIFFIKNYKRNFNFLYISDSIVAVNNISADIHLSKYENSGFQNMKAQ
jgi:hypothetical protein